MVPFASYLASESSRGRVVGNVMSGLLLGIMLSRPLSILVADLFGWHAVFVLSGAAVLVLALVLSKVLPVRRPSSNASYPALLGSMWRLLRTTPLLRRRAAYHACVFATFSLFWTTVPFLLAGPMFHFSQKAIALFALAGIAGAVAAPVAGRLADRGWTRPGTGIALVTVVLSVLLPLVVRTGSPVGVAGSAVGGWAYATGGWSAALWFGLAFPVAAILYFATEKK